MEKIKKLGAVSPQDVLFILPKTHKNLENLQWLAEEIKEMNGESYLFKGESIRFSKNEEIIDKFNKNVNSLYRDVLSYIECDAIKSSEDLKLIFAKFKDVKQKNFFNSSKRKEIFEKLKDLELNIMKEGLI